MIQENIMAPSAKQGKNEGMQLKCPCRLTLIGCSALSKRMITLEQCPDAYGLSAGNNKMLEEP